MAQTLLIELPASLRAGSLEELIKTEIRTTLNKSNVTLAEVKLLDGGKPYDNLVPTAILYAKKLCQEEGMLWNPERTDGVANVFIEEGEVITENSGNEKQAWATQIAFRAVETASRFVALGIVHLKHAHDRDFPG